MKNRRKSIFFAWINLGVGTCFTEQNTIFLVLPTAINSDDHINKKRISTWFLPLSRSCNFILLLKKGVHESFSLEVFCKIIINLKWTFFCVCVFVCWMPVSSRNQNFKRPPAVSLQEKLDKSIQQDDSQSMLQSKSDDIKDSDYIERWSSELLMLFENYKTQS